MSDITITIALLIIAYLLGSFPTGYLAGKLLKGVDLRQEGSGSTGATNVLRTLGKGPAIVVLLFDVLKGVGAIVLTQQVNSYLPGIVSNQWVDYVVAGAAFMVLLGHSRSIWLNFAGGKSVATSLGVLLAMSWPVGLATLGIFGLVIAITRIVSISSIIGAIAVTGLMIATNQPLSYIIFAIIGGIYVVWRHRSNIKRLLNGTEPKLGEKLADKLSEQGS